MSALSNAMNKLERGLYEEAAGALKPLADGSREGVIARFRRAECLSRLGRHDEAVADAQAAADADPDHSPAALWLAQTLAEAGRHDEAAAVSIPGHDADEAKTLSAGFDALAELARGATEDRAEVVDAILATRHHPIYSIALRIGEAGRLAHEPRWPDVPSVWHAYEALFERDDGGKPVHPDLPVATARTNELHPERWVRLHGICGDWLTLEETLRPFGFPPPNPREAELEEALSRGEVAAAREMADELAKGAKDKASGDLCVIRTRIEQLDGTIATASQFAGHKDANVRLRPVVVWLDLCAALLADQPLEARELADEIASPSHREFVIATLFGWSIRT